MKILILCLPAIGDGLMATPMIKVLRRKYPDAQIDVACMMGSVAYVFKNNPHINTIHYLSIYTGKKINGIFQLFMLRKSRYDVSILAFPSYRREYHLVQAIIGANKRIAHSFQTGYWLEFNFLNTDLIAVDEASHNVINNLNLTYALDIDWHDVFDENDVKYDLRLDQQDIEFGSNYLKNLGWSGNNVIGIHPGSTNSPAALLRRWPADRYAKIARYLIKNGYRVIIFTGPEEIEAANLLRRLIRSNRIHFVTDTKFNQSLGILKNIRLLICNDNGFGHLANALGVYIVTLWASTNDKLSLPYNRKLITLIRAPMFVPWYRYVLKRSIPKGVSGGMEMIKVEDVITAVRKSLTNTHHA